jgi:hypothetical protein
MRWNKIDQHLIRYYQNILQVTRVLLGRYIKHLLLHVNRSTDRKNNNTEQDSKILQRYLFCLQYSTASKLVLDFERGGFKEACKLVWTSMSTSNFIFQSRTTSFRSLHRLQFPSFQKSRTSLEAHIDLKSHISKPRTSLEAYIDFEFYLSQSTTTLEAYVDLDFHISILRTNIDLQATTSSI